MSRLRRMAAPLALVVGGGLLAAAPAAEAAPVACDTTSTAYTYVVTYQPGTRASAVDKELAAKCGTKVAYYGEIGVAIASSRNADFQQKIGVYRAYSGGKDVASAGAARSSLGAVRTLEDTQSVAAAGDLSAQQWDMKAIHAPEANKKYQGSRAVTVGVLDSGIDATHPALKAAISPSESAGCITGAPDLTPAVVGADDVRPRNARRGHDRGQGPGGGLHGHRAGCSSGVGEGRQRRRLHLPGVRGLRLRLGGEARLPGDEQQLLHRPGHVLLLPRAGRRGGVRSGPPRDHLLDAPRSPEHLGGGQLGLRHDNADNGPEPPPPGGFVVRHPAQGDRRSGDGVLGGLRGHEVVLQQLRRDRRNGSGWRLLADPAHRQPARRARCHQRSSAASTARSAAPRWRPHTRRASRRCWRPGSGASHRSCCPGS